MGLTGRMPHLYLLDAGPAGLLHNALPTVLAPGQLLCQRGEQVEQFDHVLSGAGEERKEEKEGRRRRRTSGDVSQGRRVRLGLLGAGSEGASGQGSEPERSVP